jgi:hypothetical protein
MFMTGTRLSTRDRLIYTPVTNKHPNNNTPMFSHTFRYKAGKNSANTRQIDLYACHLQTPQHPYVQPHVQVQGWQELCQHATD